MTHYVARYGDSEINITDKYPFGTGAIDVRQFDTMQDVGEYLSTYNSETMVSGNSSKYAALEAEIDEYKAINKRLVQRIDGLLAHQQVVMNYTNAATDILRRIGNSLAVGTIAQATHRERNEVSRNIVQSIINFLKTPIDTWINSQMEMEDIPF